MNASIRSRLPARRLAGAFLWMSLATMGCNVYYDEDVDVGLLTTTKTLEFDQRLPNALEDLFAQCHEPLVVKRHEVSPVGTCEGQPLTDYGDVEVQTLALALLMQPDLDFRPVFPLSMVGALDEIHGFEGLPWPVQNCEIFLDLDLELLGLGLVDLDAQWVTHDGSAALTVDLDRDTTFPFIEGTIEGDVDCPSAINEPAIQPSLPNGNYEITVSGVDVDVWFMLDVVDDRVVVSVDSEVELGAISISPALSNTVTNAAGNIEDILEEVTGKDLADFESDVNDNLADRLESMRATLEDEINDEVDSDATVESVSIVNGRLEIETSKQTVLTPVRF